MVAETQLAKLRQIPAPKNPLISPMYATDEQLRSLPPTFFLVGFCMGGFSTDCSAGKMYCPDWIDPFLFRLTLVRRLGTGVYPSINDYRRVTWTLCWMTQCSSLGRCDWQVGV